MQIVKSRTRTLYYRHGLALWQKWIIANTIAECLSSLVIAIAQATIYMIPGIERNRFLLVLVLCKGIVLGLAQCYVLHPYLRKSFWWVIATTVGTLCGWLVILAANIALAIAYAFSVNNSTISIIFLGILLLGAYLGTTIGFAQGLVLKVLLRSKIQQVSWWINTNAFAWSLALIVGFIGTELDQCDGFSLRKILVYATTGGVMGLFTGGITSINWVYLSRRNI